MTKGWLSVSNLPEKEVSKNYPLKTNCISYFIHYCGTALCCVLYTETAIEIDISVSTATVVYQYFSESAYKSFVGGCNALLKSVPSFCFVVIACRLFMCLKWKDKTLTQSFSFFSIRRVKNEQPPNYRQVLVTTE